MKIGKKSSKLTSYSLQLKLTDANGVLIYVQYIQMLKSEKNLRSSLNPLFLLPNCSADGLPTTVNIYMDFGVPISLKSLSLNLSGLGDL